MAHAGEAANKGGVVRGYASYLARKGMTSSIESMLPPDTADLLARPPLASEWVPARHSIAINEAVGSIWGPRGVREMNRETLRTTVMVVAMPLLSGLGRMFGLSPATLFTRLDLVLRSSSRGVHYGYEPTSTDSGCISVRSATPSQSLITAEAWAAGFELIIDVCGRKGTVNVEDCENGPRESIMRFGVDWSGKR
jgi:hypothetical protein